MLIRFIRIPNTVLNLFCSAVKITRGICATSEFVRFYIVGSSFWYLSSKWNVPEPFSDKYLNNDREWSIYLQQFLLLLKVKRRKCRISQSNIIKWREKPRKLQLVHNTFFQMKRKEFYIFASQLRAIACKADEWLDE